MLRSVFSFFPSMRGKKKFFYSFVFNCLTSSIKIGNICDAVTLVWTVISYNFPPARDEYISIVGEVYNVSYIAYMNDSYL